jgi:hypothetical protein
MGGDCTQEMLPFAIRIWILEYFYQTTWTGGSNYLIWNVSGAIYNWGLEIVVATISQINASWIVGEAIKKA